jgi:hypothetical protein
LFQKESAVNHLTGGRFTVGWRWRVQVTSGEAVAIAKRARKERRSRRSREGPIWFIEGWRDPPCTPMEPTERLVGNPSDPERTTRVVLSALVSGLWQEESGRRGDAGEAGGSLVVLPPKTKRSWRTAPLPPTLAEILRRHPAEQNERRSLAGSAWHAGDVFDRGDGQPIDPGTSSKMLWTRTPSSSVARATERNDLRHGFAAMLVSAGTNVRVVSDLLGHSTVGFTLQTYTHPNSDELRRHGRGRAPDPWIVVANLGRTVPACQGFGLLTPERKRRPRYVAG